MTDHLNYIEPTLQPLAVPIEQVKTDPANARHHPQRNLEAIKASLAGFGQQKPIVVDQDNVCIAGNGTLQAAKALGWSHIAVTRTTLTGHVALAFGIADNRTTDTSEWNDEALARSLAVLQNDDAIDHLLTGFNDTEIDDCIGQAMGLDVEEPLIDIDVSDSFHVLVSCNDEADQRHLYEQPTKDGHPCRLLTL